MKLEEYGVESYLDYCGEACDTANEADMKYKVMRALQTNKIALRNQLGEQKKICLRKLNECNSESDLDSFAAWLDKQKTLVTHKINGDEIKDKASLQKFISLYNEYEGKINAKRNSLKQNKED